MTDDINELQSQLTSMAIAELNKERAVNRELRKELSKQLPTIWALQEEIVLLRNLLGGTPT